MNDYQSTTEMPETPALAPMSGVAVTSFISSLILCCPVTTFLGMILGVIGFLRTGSGRRRGRGMAIAGFLIGTITTAGWIGGGTWLWKAWLGVPLRGADHVMSSGAQGDGEAAREYFVAGREPTAEMIEAFVASAEERYGAFESAELAENAQGQPGGESFDMPFVFKFAKSTIDGVVYFEVVTETNPTPTLSGSYVGISKIVIDDADLGKLELGSEQPADTP